MDGIDVDSPPCIRSVVSCSLDSLSSVRDGATECIKLGQVAQLVEQRTENPRVGGSIPPLATNSRLSQFVLLCLKSNRSFYVEAPVRDFGRCRAVDLRSSLYL